MSGCSCTKLQPPHLRGPGAGAAVLAGRSQGQRKAFQGGPKEPQQKLSGGNKIQCYAKIVPFSEGLFGGPGKAKVERLYKAKSPALETFARVLFFAPQRGARGGVLPIEH